jgi:apolipoprotein D and lipocalin family protein
MRTLNRFAALAALSSLLIGCSTNAPMRTVSHVDLPRYMGDWYVIGEIQNFAERSCVDSIESYALNADGSIDNWFSCRKKSFDAPMKRVTSAKARVVNTTTNATWHLRFYKVFSAQYLVLDLDADYQWAMVGHPSRSYGWILARSRTLPDQTYEAVLRRTRDQGYDPERFKKVPQSASE